MENKLLLLFIIIIIIILAGTLPLSADPGKVFFHNFNFETVLPVLKTTAGGNLPVLMQFELSPTRYSVFCSGTTLIQSRSLLSC
jgi:hypothetical protein